MSLLRKLDKTKEFEIGEEAKTNLLRSDAMFQTAVSDIIQRAQQVYLNDISGSTYTTALLLPFVRSAYEDYQLELELHNVSNKSTIAPPKLIPAGTQQYIPLPSAFVWPDKLEEGRVGASNDTFTPMAQRDFTSNSVPTSSLGFWCFREDGIFFPDATEDRNVRLYYKKAFPEINDDTDNVFGRAKNYLAAKISAMALHLISQNNTLADSCNTQAETQMNKIVRLYKKMDQGIPYRTLPFRSYGW